MNTTKKDAPADKLAALIKDIQEKLATADKLARQIPEASSVRPAISQAKDSFCHAGFSAEVGRL